MTETAPQGSQEKEWPKSGRVCPTCGVLTATASCSHGLTHNPVETVSAEVYPAQLVEPLVEALDCIVETPPMPETMREVARQALANFKAATQGDKDDH